MQRVQAADIGMGGYKFGQRPRFGLGKGVITRALLFDFGLPVSREIAIKIEPLLARGLHHFDAVKAAN